MTQTMETGTTRPLLGRIKGERLPSDVWPSVSSGPGLVLAETVLPACSARACSLLPALAATARHVDCSGQEKSAIYWGFVIIEAPKTAERDDRKTVEPFLYAFCAGRADLWRARRARTDG